jgi:hypothetical protein
VGNERASHIAEIHELGNTVNLAQRAYLPAFFLAAAHQFD